MFSLAAPAKINLSLEITGKRPDGYHELVSVMQTISLHDTLHFKCDRDLHFDSSDPGLPTTDNLALRAARMVRDRCAVEEGCSLFLEKRIPIAAGLGGGSSDAAAALVGSCRLWDIAADCADLLSAALDLGSDVPFFLYGQTCLVEGRGEIVTPLGHSQDCWYLLANPEVSVATSEVFAALPPSAWSDGRSTRELAMHVRQALPAKFGINGLQRTCFQQYPEVQECYNAVAAVSSGGAILSGSGATVVGLCRTEMEAVKGEETLRRGGLWSTTAKPQNATESWMLCH